MFSLERKRDLPFTLDEGTCSGFMDVRAMACQAQGRHCWEWDGQLWRETGRTLVEHNMGAMVDFGSDLILIGLAGSSDKDGTVEVYDQTHRTWVSRSKYSALRHLSRFSAVSIARLVYVFGGESNKDAVYVMNRNYVWLPHYQKLKKGRHGFRSVAIRDDTIVHIGGFEEKNFEVWILKSDGSFDIHESKTTLNNWAAYPETFVLNE